MCTNLKETIEMIWKEIHHAEQEYMNIDLLINVLAMALDRERQ